MSEHLFSDSNSAQADFEMPTEFRANSRARDHQIQPVIERD